MGELINLRVQVNTQVLTRVITSLKRTQSRATLETIRTGAEEKAALSYLKRIFPRSKYRSPGSKAELASHGAIQHLISGWRVRRVPFKSGVSIVVDHVLGNEPRVQEVLNVIDTGHGAYTWTVPKNVRFPDKRPASVRKWTRSTQKNAKNPWTRLKAGEKIHVRPRQGVYYMDRTREFILNNLVESIRRKVDHAIQRAYD
jgi:hypothetical protein